MNQPFELKGIDLFRKINHLAKSSPELNKREQEVWNAVQENPTFPKIMWDQELNNWHYFKYRLFRKLATHVVDNEKVAVTDYAMEYKAAYHDFYIFKMLTITDMVKSAAYFAKGLLKRCRKHHFVDLSRALSRYLMRYYATEDNVPAKTKMYSDLADQYLAYLQAEYEAEKYYCEYDATQDLRKRLLTIHEERAAVIEDLMDKVPTATFQLCARIFLYLQAADRNKDAAKIAQNGLEFFKNLTFEHRSGLLIFTWFSLQ